MNDLQRLRALPHISVSQLKAFIGCARKHRLHYIDRLEPAFRPVALAMGSAWHETIGQLLLCARDGNKPNGELHDVLRDALARELHADRVPVLFDDDEDEGLLVDRAMTMLDVFVQQFELPEQVLGVEVAFSMDLVDHETGEVLPVPLIGALDAIVAKKGVPKVIELKTGKRRWCQDQLAFDLQPTAYKLAAEELGYMQPKVELVLTTKGKAPALQVEEFVRTDADERDLVATAFGVLRAVDAGVDYPTRCWACRGCAYQGACR